jgi:hypothetical protein
MDPVTRLNNRLAKSPHAPPTRKVVDEAVPAIDWGDEESAPPFNAIELLDGAALAQPEPPLEYLIEALGMTAGSGAPHMFAGYGFSGKTMAAQELALAFAAGRAPWGGLTATPRRVVHVDLEQGKRLTKRRYVRLAYAMNVQLADLEDRLVVAARPNLRLEAEHRDRWLSIMRDRDLVIIDSWRAACPDVDENSSNVRATLDMLGSLSEETGCRALVIHHAKKPGEGDVGGKFSIRGSSGFYDGSDAIYVFAAAKNEPIKVSCEKAREHGDLVDDLTIEIEDVDGEFGPKSGLRIRLFGAERLAEVREERATVRNASIIAALKPRVVDAVRRAFIAGAPLTSVEQLRQQLNAGKPSVQQAVQAAIECGEIHRAKIGRSSELRPGPTMVPTEDRGPTEDRTRTESVVSDGGPRTAA